MSKSRFELVALAMFMLSGASGLVYESMWSQYLGLYLGHAAYAQALVLVIFMGGMALGAYLASRRSVGRPLRAYALVEAAIGGFGLVFHEEFALVQRLTFDALAPGLGGSALLPALQWLLAAALILPQSILLGTTFPLLSSALLRRRPEARGRGLSILYFGNSLGAAAGALLASFALLPLFGLPGTLLCAGLANVVVAAVMWFVAKHEAAPAPGPDSGGGPERRVGVLVLACALGTGLGSFVYEIVWIRMLSLVLGSSLHAFELMLSAFILGLAIGGFWIRKRLDRLADPLRFTGWVQIAMAALAIASLVVYGQSFSWLSFFYGAVAKTEGGYLLFNLVSHAIAMAVMLPATILAGMTLPAFTYALLKRGAGEEAIGRVYASNTVGAIAGVLLALQLMPLIGLRWTLGAGALVDLGIGLYLVSAGRRHARAIAPRAAVAVAVAALLVVADLDELSLVSGVYRHGQTQIAGEVELIEHGRTATIATYLSPDGRYRVLATNGKPDASLAARDDVAPSPDELTMLLLGSLPLAIHPEARTVANIGFGSGLTTHTVLGSPAVDRVVSIEIEPAVIRAARRFGDRVARAFSDPRAELHVEDAKVFFARSGATYDVIISEPSNPWVAGVGALFTEEFYAHIGRHLAPGGLLVQWIQLYETDDRLLSTIFLALAGEFEHIDLYYGDESDLLVVASDEPIGRASPRIFAGGELAAELARVGLRSVADVEARYAGDRRYALALARSFGTSAHSDFFPVLALRGPQARFEKREAVLLEQARESALPLRTWLLGAPPASGPVTLEPRSPLRDRHRTRAAALRSAGAGAPAAGLSAELRRDLGYLALARRDCAVDPGAWRAALAAVAEAVLPVGDPRPFRDVFAGFSGCPVPPALAAQLALYRGLIDVDEAATLRAAAAVTAALGPEARLSAYADLAAAMAHIRRGEHQQAIALLQRSSAALHFEAETELLFRLADGDY